MNQHCERAKRGLFGGYWPLAGTGLIGLSLVGCAQFWDDISASTPGASFGDNMVYRMNLLTNRMDPLTVLRDSKDGDMRARAYRKLSEPILEGGTEQDQAFVLELLETGARSEKQLLCRLAAVETLGKFQDPRAVEALAQAFQSPINSGGSNDVVRMGIVRALGNLGHPQSVATLTEAIQHDASTDVRIAAARALGTFDSYQATRALVNVLKEEKNIALRAQAHASLQEITGQTLPADAEAWDQFLYSTSRGQTQAKGPRPTTIQRVIFGRDQ